MLLRSMGEVREGPMRLLVLTTAYTMLLIATPAAAQDCAAIQAACVAQCRGGAGATAHSNAVTGFEPARLQACINRCAITPCQQTPLTDRLCDANAQNICNRTFQACTDACTPSTATQALVETQASCSTFCCTQFKQCLTQRFCDITTTIAITCEEQGTIGVTPTP